MLSSLSAIVHAEFSRVSGRVRRERKSALDCEDGSDDGRRGNHKKICHDGGVIHVGAEWYVEDDKIVVERNGKVEADGIYLHGGCITRKTLSDMRRYDERAKRWNNVTVRGAVCKLRAAGNSLPAPRGYGA